MNLKIKNLKRCTLLSLMLFCSFSFSVISQEKTKKELKKELKEKQKLENIKETESLIESKTFVFVAKTVLPTGMRTVNLTTSEYEVKFKPDLIDSYLPFFGRGFSGVAYGGGDGGMKFKESPEKFEIKKGKKNYEISIDVKDDKENYRLFLTVGFEGSTTLSVTSNTRSQISYFGNISKLVDVIEK